VTRLEVADDDHWEVTLEAGETIAADGVVMTGAGPAIMVQGQPRGHPRVLDGRTYWLAAHKLRAAAAERLGDSQVPWDFQWRQGLIAHELIAVAESVQAARPGDVVVIEVGSSSSHMHRMVGSVAVNLARHSPVPVTIVP
jgi:nucleotide-binding universal stress UspA family protein